MAVTCEHATASPVASIDRDTWTLWGFIVCDDCGHSLRALELQQYAPNPVLER